jgi:hypothetical protein
MLDAVQFWRGWVEGYARETHKSWLASLRWLEAQLQADIDAVRELIQAELLRKAREDNVLVMGGREVRLSPNPADGREAEIQAIMDESGQTMPQAVTSLGLIAALGLALGAVFSICLARPLLPVPRYEAPAVVAPVAVLGGQRVTVSWWRGDQIADWQRSVAAERFSVAGHDVVEGGHAVAAHNVESVIARLAAQELCTPEFWQQLPCDDGRYRWIGRVPGGPYAGRWAIVVVDAARMAEVTSFLIGSGSADERYIRNVEEKCHNGSLRPAG